MFILNDEVNPHKSSLDDMDLKHQPDNVIDKRPLVEQQPNDEFIVVEKDKTIGKKKKCQHALRINYVLRPTQERNKKLNMALKPPFGQQSATTAAPKKPRSMTMNTYVIVSPVFVENISEQPRTRSINQLMTHEPFVENLSRPHDCKRDKVTVPDYMSNFINMKNLPEYRFPWGNETLFLVVISGYR
nr:hypothetical protein [Tanacetum cinerariifolium]